MWKSGCISVLLMTLLLRGGNFLTMERGFAVDHTNVTESCRMPKACNVDRFTDWFKVGRYCVKYFNNPANFTEAEVQKQSPGAHLVSVHSEKDNKDLFCIVNKFSPNNLRFWLGGFVFYKSGQFLWLDGSFWDYQNWACGEPNNMYTNIEQCVEMNWKKNETWNDDSCDVSKNYICAFKRHDMLEVDPE